MKSFTVFFRDGRQMVVTGDSVSTYQNTGMLSINSQEGYSLFPADAVMGIVLTEKIADEPKKTGRAH